MSDHRLADELSTARGDHFAALRAQNEQHAQEHGCGVRTPAPWQARRLAVLARAVRATYVLHIGGGSGYTSLHIASAFGHTGRLDAVEDSAPHGQLLEQAAGRYALSDRIRVMSGRAQDVVPPLNGPYDLVIIEGQLDDLDGMYEDLVRLTRVGGSIVAVLEPGMLTSSAADTPVRAWAEHLSRDERTEVSASGDVDLVVGVRVR